MSCDDAVTAAPACERLLDVPSFAETTAPSICDAAAAAADGVATERLEAPIEIRDVSCNGMTLRTRTGDVRVSFGDVAQAAHLMANALVTGVVLTARVEAGECAHTLILEGAPTRLVIELHDVAATGGTVTSRWLGDARLAPIGSSLASCPALERVCVSRALSAFAIDACGGSSLPVGSCGDDFGAGFAGASSCGDRIHFAIFPTYYERICD